jgi:hypothetical protein
MTSTSIPGVFRQGNAYSDSPEGLAALAARPSPDAAAAVLGAMNRAPIAPASAQGFPSQAVQSPADPSQDGPRVSMIGDRDAAAQDRVKQEFYSLMMNPTQKDLHGGDQVGLGMRGKSSTGNAGAAYQARLQALGQAAGLWDNNTSREKMNTENNANTLARDRMSIPCGEACFSLPTYG